MKLLSFLFYCFVLSSVAVVFANPLFILAVSLALSFKSYYQQALYFAFLGGVFVSLFSFGEGFMRLGLLSLLLVTFTLASFALRLLWSNLPLFKVFLGSIFISLCHFVLFKNFMSQKNLVALTFFILIFVFWQSLLVLFKRSRELRL